MLILLQPGIQPLGQFDVYDEDIDGIAGGEVAAFANITSGDTVGSDVNLIGPLVHLKLGFAGASTNTERNVWGLVDEGTTGGGNLISDGIADTLYSGSRSYGTSYGKMVGGVTGQGTGLFGSSGIVTVGPSTINGSGKATLWTKPGLYGITADAFRSIKDFDSAITTTNYKLYGSAAPPLGKITDSFGAGQTHIGYSIRGSRETSLVSTPAYYANTGKTVYDYCVIYMVGCS